MRLLHVTGSATLLSLVLSVLMVVPARAQTSLPSVDALVSSAMADLSSRMPDMPAMLPALPAPDRFIVLLKDGATPEWLMQRHSLSMETVFSQVRGFAGTLSSSQLSALRADPSVLLVEQDVIVTMFPTVPAVQKPKTNFTWPPWPGWPFPPASSRSSSVSPVMPVPPSSSSSRSSSVSSAPSSAPVSSRASSTVGGVSVPTGINRIDAELSPLAAINNGGPNADIDVAVIDTGVADHADLNIANKKSFVSTEPGQLNDLNGHGTHVAGTIAALDNGTGVTGVVPGARIWSVRVLDRNGSGYMSDIIAGIDYVAQNAGQIEVANMSLGCECTSQAMNAALDRATNAGVVFAVAAGNSNKNSATFSPANHPRVITVSAIADYNGQPGGGAPATCSGGTDDRLASFSNYGSAVDIAAPGVCIQSTWLNGGYKLLNGTSMASPHVAGAAALAVLKHGKPADANGVASIRQKLIDTAFPQNSPNGFTGDKDSSAEPLLNVGSF
jgi:subtilisin